jgi:homeobox-leucine zipper protein
VVFPSPLVRARKRTFLRHCKTLENGATAIVDISVEDGDGTLMKCHKMASGVLIEPISSDSCKV